MASRRRATEDNRKRNASDSKPNARRRRRVAQEEAVMLTLSPAQIEQVLRAVTSGARQAPAVGGVLTEEQLSSAREQRYRSLLDDRRLSRSLLAGLLVLTCFPAGGGELGIADLARRLDMRTSTIHRYVSTLLAAGLLERDPASRQYRLAQA